MTLGDCKQCGVGGMYFEQMDATVRDDFVVTMDRCIGICYQTFFTVWRSGKLQGTITTSEKNLGYHLPISNNPDFVAFKSGQKELTKMSWQAIQNNDLTKVEIFDFPTLKKDSSLRGIVIEGDRIIILIEEGYLYFIEPTCEPKRRDLPPRFSTEDPKKAVPCCCIIRTRKNRYVVSSERENYGKPEQQGFIMVDQSCKLLSRVEFGSERYVRKMTMVGQQVLVASTEHMNFHLLLVRNSKLALIRSHETAIGINQHISALLTIDHKSFLLKFEHPDIIVIFKLKV